MCREHLPVWQKIWESIDQREDVQFISIAMDAQGANRVKPYVDRAGLAFPTAVDREGVLWERLGFNFVPLQILFDEQGREVLRTRGGPDEELEAKLKEAFAVTPPPREQAGSYMGEAPDPAHVAEARRLFADGVKALEAGKKEEAAAVWRRALEKDPGNWLVRKQIWALEDPDRFYDGDIDFSWQREKMR